MYDKSVVDSSYGECRLGDYKSITLEFYFIFWFCIIPASRVGIDGDWSEWMIEWMNLKIRVEFGFF